MSLLDLPRRGYVKKPTDLVYLPKLTEALGHKARIWVKRDDLLPGAGGGNKTRKLDYLIADALRHGADSLITCGAVQSNHARLTLSWAKTEGLQCHLVLEVPEGREYDPHAGGNNLLYRLLGADSITVVPEGKSTDEAMEEKARELRRSGKHPYIIPMGGSNALGAAGYAGCGLEIAQQAFELRINPAAVVLPSGSAGTQAGLAVGLADAGLSVAALGINVSQTNAVERPKALRLAKETAKLLGVPPPKESLILNSDEYFAPGYALPNPAMVEAVKLFARTEGILLDPVYSGKAAAGLIGLLRLDAFPPDSDVIFLHTGGTAALYEYKDAFF